MPLSAQEMAAARNAYRENYEYDQWIKYPLWMRFLYFVPLLMSTIDHWRKGQTAEVCFFGLFCCAMVPLIVMSWRRVQRLKLGYAENKRLLDELRLRESGKLPDEVEEGVLGHYPPLLDSWNRRLEKRALLWRLDAFLSRKPISG